MSHATEVNLCVLCIALPVLKVIGAVSVKVVVCTTVGEITVD